MGAFLARVGMAAWLTLLWAAVVLVRVLVAGIGRSRHARFGKIISRVPVAGGAAVIVLGCLTAVSAAPLVSSSVPALSDLASRQATNDAAAAVARVVPGRSFILSVKTANPYLGLAMEQRVAYRLRVQGLRPRLTGQAIGSIGEDAEPVPGLPTVVVHYSPSAAAGSAPQSGPSRGTVFVVVNAKRRSSLASFPRPRTAPR